MSQKRKRESVHNREDYADAQWAEGTGSFTARPSIGALPSSW